jgi:chromosome segregation ATPase
MARVNKKGDAAIASIQAKIDSVRAERDKKRAQKNEAVDPERIANLQQRIQKMTANMSKIDMAKPENKTKQAIIKSDLQTAQLRLKDLIQKKTSELGKEMKETKNGYKSFKQSLKKEQDKKDTKKTMTGQPVDKIDVDPKLSTQ